jgi:chemotaxis protein MotB
MNQTSQPFTDHVTQAHRNRRNTALIGFLFLLIVLLGGALFHFWSATKATRKELEAIRTELGNTTEKLAAANENGAANQDEITTLKTRLADLEKEREAVKQKAKGLEDEMREQLESRDVTISKLQGKLTVNILDRVMFDSGEARLKPGGEAVMEKIATLLREHPELKIHVIGHTDNIPIRPEAHSRFASNWELSTARALAALHFLTDKSGIDPHRVGAVGYGEYRPIADNSTAEGRAKNRRIAIVILPDELIDADAAPVLKIEPSTNVAPNLGEPIQ